MTALLTADSRVDFAKRDLVGHLPKAPRFGMPLHAGRLCAADVRNRTLIRRPCGHAISNLVVRGGQLGFTRYQSGRAAFCTLGHPAVPRPRSSRRNRPMSATQSWRSGILDLSETAAPAGDLSLYFSSQPPPPSPHVFVVETRSSCWRWRVQTSSKKSDRAGLGL